MQSGLCVSPRESELAFTPYGVTMHCQGLTCPSSVIGIQPCLHQGAGSFHAISGGGFFVGVANWPQLDCRLLSACLLLITVITAAPTAVSHVLHQPPYLATDVAFKPVLRRVLLPLTAGVRSYTT